MLSNFSDAAAQLMAGAPIDKGFFELLGKLFLFGAGSVVAKLSAWGITVLIVVAGGGYLIHLRRQTKAYEAKLEALEELDQLDKSPDPAAELARIRRIAKVNEWDDVLERVREEEARLRQKTDSTD